MPRSRTIGTYWVPGYPVGTYPGTHMHIRTSVCDIRRTLAATCCNLLGRVHLGTCLHTIVSVLRITINTWYKCAW